MCVFSPLSRRSAMRAALAAVSLLLVASTAAAQFRSVPGREYREFFNPVNPVAGEAVVGLSIAPTEAAQRAAVVWVFLREPFSGEIHLETATADGRFRGEGFYSGSTKGNEWVALELVAQPGGDDKGASPRPANPAALAIAARGPGRTLYLASWGEPPTAGSAARLRLYVNSRRAEMFVRAGQRLVRCASTGISQPVRFDSYCDVAMSDVPADGRVLLIRRDQFDEQSQTIKVLAP